MQKKNLCSISQVENSTVCSTSLMPSLECGAQSDNVVHAPKDSYGNVNCPGEKDNRESHSRTVFCNEQGSFMGAESYNKASGLKVVRGLECPLYNVEENSRLTCKKRETSSSQNEHGCNENCFGSDKNNLSLAREAGISDATHIRNRNLNHGASLAESASTSSVKSSKVVPSFEFHVSSEEGLNLIIDLNSSPSDWPKRLENEVCGCHNAHDNKFGSLREELELLGSSSEQMKSSSIWNTDADGHVQAGSSSYSVKRECDPVVVDKLYGADGSLRSSPIKPCNVAMAISAQLQEDKELLLISTPNSDIQKHVTSGTESCPIDRETIPLESSVINTSQVKSSSNCVVNSTPEGPKSLNSLEHQNSVVGDKNCDDLTLQNTCTHVSPTLVYAGSSSSGSMEMQSSEVVSQQKDTSCSPCRNNGFPDVVDPMLNVETRDDELANSSTSQDMFVCAEEWERSNLINGAETSESLHSKKSFDKTPEDSEADEVLKRKKQHSEGEDLNCCDELSAKILRSRKHRPEGVLPRRSMRLISKTTPLYDELSSMMAEFGTGDSSTYKNTQKLLQNVAFGNVPPSILAKDLTWFSPQGDSSSAKHSEAIASFKFILPYLIFVVLILLCQL